MNKIYFCWLHVVIPMTTALKEKPIIITYLSLNYVLQRIPLSLPLHPNYLTALWYLDELCHDLIPKLTLQTRNTVFFRTTHVWSNTEKKKMLYFSICRTSSSPLFHFHYHSSDTVIPWCFPELQKLRINLYDYVQILRNVHDHLAITLPPSNYRLKPRSLYGESLRATKSKSKPMA